MFAIFGICGLIILIYGRFHEFVEPLRAIPFLYLFVAAALFGIAVDVRLRTTRLFATPQLPWVLAFFGWAVLTALFRMPRSAPTLAFDLAISIALFLVIAHGAQGFRALGLVAGVVFCLMIFVTTVGVHQAFSDKGCVLVEESIPGDQSVGSFDGRSCTKNDDCYLGDVEPGAEYFCARIGLFGTTSTDDDRIRYRGVLQDPNELALAAGIGLPLGFVYTRRRTRKRKTVGFAILLLVGFCTILTQSRGGQLVFLAVLGAYFLKRFGYRGAIVGALAVAPVLLYGGRESLEAEASTSERIDCWYEAISMWRSHPFVGVGFGQFTRYHYLTAHNAYLLTLAELGIIGMFLFTGLIYVSAKVPISVLARYSSGELALSHGMARSWGMGLSAAFAGLAVGIFFLSFAYHYILWIYLGLSGALYGAVRRHDPDFRVSFSVGDLLLVVAGAAAIIGSVYGLVHFKLS